jgi:hypothetical protein
VRRVRRCDRAAPGKGAPPLAVDAIDKTLDQVLADRKITGDRMRRRGT